MKNNISKFDICANCGACLNSCPENAIYVKKDQYFYEYKVDESKCVDCGLCVQNCPLNMPEKHLSVLGAYGGWHIDSSVVKTSSSGGAFSAIANIVLKKGGVVYGAAFSDDHKEVTTQSTKSYSLDNLKRSKYVESFVGYSFREIKEDLENDKWVCFCGTPCQAAGLKRFLRKNYDKLIIIDFACGGLTSHKIYSDYCDDLEKKYKSRIKGANFRAGIYGWRQYALKIDFENGKSYISPSQFDPYVFTFMYSKYGNRDNCFECKFRDSHYSDFIIADFWRFNDYSFLENNDEGISLILTNSEKAESIMSELNNDMYLEKIDLNQGVYNCFVKPPVSEAFLKSRDTFFNNLKTYGLTKAAIKSGMQHGITAKLKTASIKKNKGHIK